MSTINIEPTQYDLVINRIIHKFKKVKLFTFTGNGKYFMFTVKVK